MEEENPEESFYGLEMFDELSYAIDNLIDHKIILLPPEPNYLTDEEEYDDNDLICVDIPSDVPGKVVINQSMEADEYFTNYEEPLNKLKKKSQIYSWEKVEPKYSSFQAPIDFFQNLHNDQLMRELKYLTPTDIFEKIMDDTVIDLIVNQTNLYAHQKNNHNFSITPLEVRTFIGVLLYTGYVQVPEESMYWSSDDDLICIEVVEKSMSKSRYLEIKKYLHFVDNSQLDKDDKMFKLRPLMNILNDKFKQWGIFHTELSIDEVMINYFGNPRTEPRISRRPVYFGYIDWMLCSSTGYCYAFDTYCAKDDNQYINTETLGTKVVLSLLENLEFPDKHVVYFDNNFTTLELMILLKEKKIRATGIIKKERLNNYPIQDNKIMKNTINYQFDKNNELLIVEKGNNIIATNFDLVEPISKVQSWSMRRKAVVDVLVPKVYKNYYRGARGVNLNDQSVDCNRTTIRGKKWWWVLFTHMINLAMTNAWKISQEVSTKKMTQFDFTNYVTTSYLNAGQNVTSRKPLAPLNVNQNN